MEVDLVKLAELIDAMTTQRNKLRQKNDLLRDIIGLMERAWEDDTRWEEEGRADVNKIIECNEKTIELFTTTIKNLTGWLEDLAKNL